MAPHSKTTGSFRRRVVCTLLVVVCLSAFSTEAFALDKRLKLLFKTAGYGAAAGLVIGAATTAMGLGGFRNVLMGTSSGMYAGIVLAAYIVATPTERKGPPGRRNPYAPKKPVGPDDYNEDDEDIQDEMVPDRDRDRDRPRSSLDLTPRERLVELAPAVGGPTLKTARTETGVWAPVFQLQF